MTVPAEYFSRLYEAQPDPWGFADRWYEERKRAITLSALPERRYATAYEPGCSIGVLTAGLAERCDSVLASDVSQAALERAADRLGRKANVRLERRTIPGDWPEGRFGLVVLSELLYYFADADLADVTRRAVAAVEPGGTLVSVHWRHPVSDYPQRGDVVQDTLASAAVGRLVKTVAHLEADFTLDLYVMPRPGERDLDLSVGARSGLR